VSKDTRGRDDLVGIIKQKVKLNEYKINALIDSGAETSFVNEKTAKRLKLKKGKKVNVYLGDETKRIGYESVGLIQFGKETFPIKLVIIKKLGKDNLIIGVDFLQYNKYKLDFKDDKIKVKKSRYNYKGYRL